ncbi:MAG: phosphatidylglycerophosphatase A [Deltaproteobacteria bacterium]|nr:phosphatidylglycerophosphatase A [Deltaproteobacteria bacterium]
MASGLGLGFMPWFPGTFGSLAALPLWYLGGGTGVVHFGLLGFLLLLSVPAVRVEMQETGQADPPSVVIDEIAGLLLAATGIPWGWMPVALLFLLFRFFDIVKFGPAAWANHRKGVFYVVADDLAAGVYANLACRGILWLTG